MIASDFFFNFYKWKLQAALNGLSYPLVHQGHYVWKPGQHTSDKTTVPKGTTQIRVGAVSRLTEISLTLSRCHSAMRRTAKNFFNLMSCMSEDRLVQMPRRSGESSRRTLLKYEAWTFHQSPTWIGNQILPWLHGWHGWEELKLLFCLVVQRSLVFPDQIWTGSDLFWRKSEDKHKAWKSLKMWQIGKIVHFRLVLAHGSKILFCRFWAAAHVYLIS